MCDPKLDKHTINKMYGTLICIRNVYPDIIDTEFIQTNPSGRAQSSQLST